MEYKSIDKIIPPDSGVNSVLFENESESSESEKEEETPQQPQPPRIVQHHDAAFVRSIAKAEAESRNTEDDKEEQLLMGRLRRWRESYTVFETDGAVFSKKLKTKVDKVLADGAKLGKLQAIEQELKASVGEDITSPPKQADIILNNVNPLIENMLISFGYDVTGFSEVAKVSCRKALVMTLIDSGFTGSKKIPSYIQFMLIYAGSMSAVYTHNKLKKVHEPLNAGLQHSPKLEQPQAPEISPPVSVLQPPPSLLPPGIEPVQYQPPSQPPSLLFPESPLSASQPPPQSSNGNY